MMSRVDDDDFKVPEEKAAQGHVDKVVINDPTMTTHPLFIEKLF